MCKSQNSQCVCKSPNTVQNVSVSHKIVNVSVSHKIVIYRVIVRGLDRGGRTMVCDVPNWCLADYMVRNNYQTLSNTAKKRHNKNIKYFVTYRHFLRDLQTLLIFLKIAHIST